MRIVLIFSSLIGLLLSLPSTAKQPFYIYAEKFPPYNFEKDGRVTGISVELLTDLFATLQNEYSYHSIRITAWSQAFERVLYQDNAILLSTSRTPEREALFKWVGPIANNHIVLLAKKDSNIVISSLQDLEQYRVAAVAYDLGDHALMAQGVVVDESLLIDGVDALEKAIRMLDRGRFDLLAYEKMVFENEVQSMGLSVQDYQTVFSITKSKLYYAFNKNVNDEVINQFQKTLDSLKKTPKFQQIFEKYKHYDTAVRFKIRDF
jgi:polar amino acid transport system substrate-binding protein